MVLSRGELRHFCPATQGCTASRHEAKGTQQKPSTRAPSNSQLLRSWSMWESNAVVALHCGLSNCFFFDFLCFFCFLLFHISSFVSFSLFSFMLLFVQGSQNEFDINWGFHQMLQKPWRRLVCPSGWSRLHWPKIGEFYGWWSCWSLLTWHLHFSPDFYVSRWLLRVCVCVRVCAFCHMT